MSDLTSAEIIAVSGVFKGKAVDEAKAALPDGAVVPINLKCHINGTVTKGHGTPDVTTTVEASVELETFNVYCWILRELGIGPKRLKEALVDLPDPSKLEVDGEFFDLFKEAATRLRKKLKPQRVTTNGKRGSVTMAGSCSKIVK